MGPGGKTALRLKMTNQERGYYSNMLALAKPADPSKVTGAEAVTFFRKSNLSNDKLKSIWSIAARSNPEYLSKDEFYIALRLIAYAQNNIEATENSIVYDLQVDLPNFDDSLIRGGNGSSGPDPAKQPTRSTLPPSMGQLPSFHDLDFSNPDVKHQMRHSAFNPTPPRQQT